MTQSSPIRVVLVDDHQLVRAGIGALLRELPDVDLVGEGADGETAIRLAQELVPDVLFLDMVMPGMSGLVALEQIIGQQPELKVIILSMHSSEEHVVRSLQLGGSGYMLKDVAPDELPMALKAVMSGETWLSSAISRTAIAEYVGRTAHESPLDALTARQHQVLRLLAEGSSTKDIAVQLELSVKTIETFRAQIMERLDRHNLAGLVHYAIRQGIVPL
ncbi:MAG: DNA-binding response regulator [Rhodocyclaceae bacterium]|nr:MAG: DNA-binding response regulator [Rhodocyclaceae bacterium]